MPPGSASSCSLSLDNHLAEVDPDSHFDAPLLGQRGVALRQAPLQGRSAFDRVNHAAELREQAVTHELEDAPMLPFDLWFKEILPMRAQPMKGIRLILLHDSAIADDVGSKNGR